MISSDVIADGAELSGSGPDHSNRPVVADLDTPRGLARSADEATRHQHPDRLGKSQGIVRKACQQAFRHHLRGRQNVCEAAMEQTRGLVMGEELPALLSRAEGSQSGKTTPHTWGGLRECDSSACPADRADTHSTNGQDCPKGNPAGLPISPDVGRARLDKGGNRDTSARREQEQQAGYGAADQTHGDSDQPGEGEPDPSPDCNSAARTAEGDSRIQLSRVGVPTFHGLHANLQGKATEIEHGLISLKADERYVGSRPKIVKSHGQYFQYDGSKKSKGQQNPKDQIDLLEIYCEPNSQLSKQVQRMGGKSLRFTKDDGDLSTPDGQQKLWGWIYLFEPRHIWVAPECRLWGNFSRFNMGRSTTMFDQINLKRKTDGPHLVLCNQLYLHQISESRHFHLEQPKGSEMVLQPELDDVRKGTLPATFDMCRVGKLRDRKSVV